MIGKGKRNMYYIKIQNLEKENNIWTEAYESIYLYNKRLNKLKYSKKLLVLMSWKEGF